ncbi:hypothetical protein HYU07_02390 [Candidatus Woesearchaeota archaeon]|nr:hypothetical protein [Candidatus Woesearchaeota archaeon]
MGDLEAKLIRTINLNGKDVGVFLAFNKQQYCENDFSFDFGNLVNAYSRRKKPNDLKRNRRLMMAAKIDSNIFLGSRILFADFEKKVETIYAEIFLDMLKEFPLPLHLGEQALFPPKKITLEVSRAIEDEAENTATIDEKNSTKEHCIVKYHGRALAERLFPTFFLNGGSIQSIKKSSRHEMVHFIDLFTINKAEREGLMLLEELNAPYSARKLYYLIFEFLKEARATTYEFIDYHKLIFKEEKGKNFRNSIIEMCKENDIGRVKEIYDKKIDDVTGIYRQSFLAAFGLGASYEGLINKKTEQREDKLIITCLPHGIRDKFMKDTALIHPMKFIESSAKAFNEHQLEFYCPLTPQFVHYVLEETLKGMERTNKEKIKELFFNQTL